MENGIASVKKNAPADWHHNDSLRSVKVRSQLKNKKDSIISSKLNSY
jgi:hypothetical protein